MNADKKNKKEQRESARISVISVLFKIPVRREM